MIYWSRRQAPVLWVPVVVAALVIAGCGEAVPMPEAVPTTTAAPVTSAPDAPGTPVPLEVSGPGRYEADVMSGGLVRRFVLFVPAAAPDPAPLVIVFHGFTASPEAIEEASGFSAVAEAEGFLVAYPAGSGFPRRWLAIRAQGEQDVAFTRDLVALVGSEVAVDPDRVYAAGFSNGGGMAARLACEAADLIAAVGPVAAAYPADDCSPARPVPLAAIHGTDDRVVPYGGRGEGLPAVEEVAEWWGEHNGCDPEAAATRVTADVVRLAWGGCRSGADVVLYRVEGGRHGWPGSGDQSVWGKTTDAVSGAALLWEFFAAHPMP